MNSSDRLLLKSYYNVLSRIGNFATGAFRFVLGSDVFISYARTDATDYAAALANSLSSGVQPLSCHLDQWDTRPGLRVPKALLREARNAKGLVVIASPAAANSSSMDEEIEAFLRVPGPIVLVTFAKCDFTKALWFRRIAGIAHAAEVGGEEALRSGTPSPEILRRIINAVGYWTRNTRIHLAARTGLAVVVVATVVLLNWQAIVRYLTTIEQGVRGKYHWRMVMGPSVLTVEQEKEKAAKPGSDFTECANGCPMMIVVKAGKFVMGSPESEPGRWDTEGPQHEVTIAKPFAVSKFEVTFAEWDACVAAATCRPNVKDEWGRVDMPVINVTWNDAKKYVDWLAWLTGRAYRLLTEAEWEYAARADTTTSYSWGDDPGKGNATCNGCSSQWDQWDKRMAPVGQFKPNAFGLYDMHGNVREWVEDVWHENYDGAPTNGSAWLQGGDQSGRAVRGGSWDADPPGIRAAIRYGSDTGNVGNNRGFRLARTLNP